MERFVVPDEEIQLHDQHLAILAKTTVVEGSDEVTISCL